MALFLYHDVQLHSPRNSPNASRQRHYEDFRVVRADQLQLDERTVRVRVRRDAGDIGHVEVVVVGEHDVAAHQADAFAFLQQRIDGRQRIDHHGLAHRHDAQRGQTGGVELLEGLGRIGDQLARGIFERREVRRSRQVRFKQLVRAALGHEQGRRTGGVFAFFILCTTSVFAQSNIFTQRPVLTDEEEVTTTVTKEIDEVFQSSDFTKKKSKKYADVKGTMVIDIGVVQNGKVSSFFKVDSDIKNIDFINFMSDYILQHKFQFKLQKQQRYKIRYTITF